MCNPYETGGTCSGPLILHISKCDVGQFHRRPLVIKSFARKPGIVAFSLLWQVGSRIITELTPSSARSQLGAQLGVQPLPSLRNV